MGFTDYLKQGLTSIQNPIGFALSPFQKKAPAPTGKMGPVPEAAANDAARTKKQIAAQQSASLSAPKPTAPRPPTPQVPPPPPVNPATEQLKQEAANISKYGVAVPPGSPPQPSGATQSAGTSPMTPPPAPPAPPAAAPDPFQQYLDALKQSYQPTSQEQAIQKQLSDLASKQAGLQSQYATGVQDINQQATLQPFATGRQQQLAQQLALQEQALGAQATPLQLQLASEQAQRQGMGTYAQQAYEAEQQREAANKPIEVGGSLVNPKTGEVIYKGSSTVQPTASIQEYEYAKSQGYQGSYTDYQNEDANRKAKANNINAAGLSPGLTTAALKLSDDFENATKNYKTVVDAYNKINASAADPSAAGDLSLIFAYMKLLDPTSVVREGEFATAQNAGSVPQTIQAAYNKAISGERLAPALRQDFISRAGSLYQTDTKQYEQTKQQFTDRANAYGIPPDLVVRNLTSSETGSTGSYTTPDGQTYEQGADGLYYPKANGGAGSPVAAVNIPKSSRLAYVNNNPGNLRYVGQAGAKQGEGGFAKFPTPAEGFQALKDQIGLDASRGLTLRQFVYKYAPPSENDSEQYLQQMMAATGVGANTPISSIDKERIARAFALKESSTRIG